MSASDRGWEQSDRATFTQTSAAGPSHPGRRDPELSFEGHPPSLAAHELNEGTSTNSELTCPINTSVLPAMQACAAFGDPLARHAVLAIGGRGSG